MSDVKMPSAETLWKTIKRILESEADVEIKVKANGEVAIYKIKKNKVPLD